MPDLIPFAVIHVGASLALASILLLVYWRIQRAEFLPFWAFYWIFIAMTLASSRLVAPLFPSGNIVKLCTAFARFLVPFNAVLIICAAQSVGGGISRRAIRVWLAEAAAVGTLMAGGAFLGIFPFSPTTSFPIIRALSSALAMVFFAYRLAFKGRSDAAKGRPLLVALSLVYAVHNLALGGIPALHAYGSSGYSPWSATIGILFQFALTIVFTLSAIEHADQARKDKSELDRQLRSTEDRRRLLALALESSDECVGITDAGGRLVYANEAFLRTYGYKEHEVIGLRLDGIRSPRNPPELLSGIVEVAKKGWWRGELLNRTKDGKDLPVSQIASGVFDDQGKLTAMIDLTHDITDQKRAEEERIVLEAQLAQAQKMESIGRLAGGVAHDFNNMLTVILGYAAMAKAELPAGTPLWSYLAEIEKAGNRSKQITQQLLGFSRQQIIAPMRSNLNDLVKELMEPLARLIGEDIEFSFLPGDELWTVVVDASQVNQILLNLVVNARDAMPSGGKLTIETGNVIIPEKDCPTRTEAVRGAFVELVVSDTGVGMSPEIVTRIFEPFFTMKGRDEGTGLGLSVVYGIVKQNGGCVDVHSEPGRGSTFRIYLPRMEGEKDEDASSADVPMAAGSGTVLVVEDNDLVREMVTSSLERIGYTPLVAASPAHAIELCSSAAGSQIRIVLTDVVMPGMNGMDLRDRILELRPEMRVLFMSGYAPNVIVNHGILKPGEHFIQKPFTIDELGKRMDEVLGLT